MSPTSYPFGVSVVIPAINEAERIERAVLSAWQAGADEVIVVDGGSTDDTRPRAANRNAKVIESEPGRARQQNFGARHANFQILLFLHADNALGPRAFEQLRRRASIDSEHLWGGFRQRILDPAWIYRVIEYGNSLRITVRHRPFGDQAIFVAKRLFHEVGGFPDIPLMEDVVLGQRLSQYGPPCLLPGPVEVDPRRWKKRGPINQTLQNWKIQWLFMLGTDPSRLAETYRRHDQSNK